MANALARRRFCALATIAPPLPPLSLPPPPPAGTPDAEYVLDFGEHKGKTLASLPSGYLGYIVQHFKHKDDPKPRWAKRAQEILDVRNARRIADDNLKRDLVSAVEQSTREASVVQVLEQLECQEVQDPSLVYGTLLRRCSKSRSLQDGQLVHKHILSSGSGRNRFLANLLIQMYGKCGHLHRARAIFDAIPNRNDHSYGMMMLLYVKKSQPVRALELWQQMEDEGIRADAFIVTTALAACTTLRALEQGRAIHEHLVISEFKTDAVLETTLLKFYSKCGCIEGVKRVFQGMRRRDQHCWSAMIAALAHNGRPQEALVYYRRMISEGLQPNAVTYTAAFKACSGLASLEEGQGIHCRIEATNVPQDEVLQDALLDMYLRCGELKMGRKVFDAMGDSRNVVSWTFLMASYVHAGHHREALELYHRSTKVVEPNAYTFATVLSACAGLGDLDYGRKVHGSIVARGLQSDATVQNALVTMYCKCGCPEQALKVFELVKRGSRDVNIWTSIITAFTNHGCPHQALQLFKSMDVKPNSVTLSSVLDACGRLGALEKGRQIHKRIDFLAQTDELPLQHSLVGMYASCGSPDDARAVLSGMKKSSVPLVNILLESYAQHGHTDKVLEVYHQAAQEGLKLDGLSFVHLLTSFSNNPAATSAVKDCKRYFQVALGDHLVVPWLEHYLALVKALCRAKKLDRAEQLLGHMPCGEATPMLWMLLLRACRLHGDVNRGKRIAGKLFKLAPDKASPYLELSRLYTDVGKHENAAAVMKLLKERGISPGESSSSFVEGPDGEVHRFSTSSDGQLEGPRVEEVKSLLLAILKPLKEEEAPGADAEDGSAGADAAAAAADSAAGQEEIVTAADNAAPAENAQAVDNGQAEAVTAADNAAPAENAQAVDNGQAEAVTAADNAAACLHSEVLAIGYSLLTNEECDEAHECEGSEDTQEEEATLRVVKTTRMSTESHDCVKLISHIVERKIVVRDHSRFHSFEKGLCSCGDFW